MRESDVVQAVAKAMIAGAPGFYEPKRQPSIPGGVLVLLHTLLNNPPDVLVSLHCDASEKHPPCIHESRILYRSNDPVSSRREESAALAEMIRGQALLFAEKSRIMKAPYLREGRYYTPGVLIDRATRAAVLVELGFISDVHVEKAMRTEHWIAQAAGALTAAIQSYL